MARPKKEGNLLEIKCDNCNKLFYRYKSAIENRASNCCSINCAKEYQKHAGYQNKK